ncbi:glycosyltransferase [Chamaesiphon polymorphus]|uniref:Glycosyl transferase n=1 Tax=Chamaesiphon polymorphus CCALA 037 TaxID=2107692 RepID=A0A2T1GND5_9CYAN|nr:glycosyltransferase [Chamaesiphon polymorphus]PSB59452.1 glycosyl transferase [Chamaesiphon polymorphus CCALA 037]
MSDRLVTERTQTYFDAIAFKLDWWAKRNRYYYQDLDRLHQFLIPAGSNVLEIGCGTGNLLAKILPNIGVGIDFASAAIDIAKTKYPDLHFYCLNAENIPLATRTKYPFLATEFDYIILSGVLGDLTNIQRVLEQLQQLCHPHTRLVINFHNFLWEPILHLAERIGQRRPQSPQNWLSMQDVINLLNITGYQPVKIGRRLLLPKYIPILSNLVNRYLSHIPIVDRLNLTNYIVARQQLYFPGEKTFFSAEEKRHQLPTIERHYTVSVIIPARNEAGNIAAAIERLPQLGKHTEVIFVEGHSQDDTWNKLQNVVQEYRGNFTIHAFQQSGKGKGDAVRLGFEKATGDILIILDADLTVQPEELVNFVSAIVSGRGEFINGSRLVYPYSPAAMPWLNTVANKFFALVFSFLLGQNIKDTLCGTKVLWREDYLRIVANRSYFGDFDPFGDFDLLFGAAKLNLHIVEVPVRYQPRTYGKSNIAHVREGLVLLKMCLYAARKIKFV